MSRSLAILMDETRKALGESQNGLARRMGVSRRTGQRWNAAGGPPSYELRKMAALVFPANPSLAAELAARSGVTLEAIGLVKPAPPAPPPAPRVPDRAVDAVVCAAAEAMEAIPQAVRPALLAACTCARELGLTLDDLERVLRGNKRKPAPAA
jgi:transcriptional regulator with XRE-family HTH domain